MAGRVVVCSGEHPSLPPRCQIRSYHQPPWLLPRPGVVIHGSSSLEANRFRRPAPRGPPPLSPWRFAAWTENTLRPDPEPPRRRRLLLLPSALPFRHPYFPTTTRR